MDQTCTPFSEWFFSVDWLEVFRALTQLLVGLAWPAAVLLLGWLFRHEIRNKFSDIESAGLSGVTFRAQEKKGVVDIQGLQLDVANHRPAVRMIEESIFNELKRLADEEQIKTLVNQLAIARLGRHFEEIYSIIFGSQIDGLRRIEAAGGDVSLGDAEEFYANVQSQNEFYAKHTFSEWSQYLKVMNLVRMEGSTVTLTDMGQEFLLFVASVKANQTRPN
jgi:hypothetical protein